jgi:hypothetical protein
MHLTLTAAELAAHDTVAAAGTFVLGLVSLGFGWDQIQQDDPVGFLMILLGGLLILGALA